MKTAELTRAGLNLIGQGLSIYDADLRLAVSNRMFAAMFDLPPRLVRPGAAFADTIRFLAERGEYGEVDDIDAAVAERVAQARTFEPHYLERTRPSGQVVSVEGSPLPEGGWVAVYTDITAIKAQERLLRARSEVLSDQVLAHAEELAAANRRLEAARAIADIARTEATEMAARIRLTTEMLPAHIARVGRDRRYTFSNRRLGDVLPGAGPDIVGRAMEDVLAPIWPAVRPHLERALGGDEDAFEVTHEASGRRLRVSFTPDRDGDEVVGVYALSMDVTQEAQARAALAQAAGRQVAAQLTSGMAHDFGNLLTAILGLSDKLGRMELPGEAGEAVDAIRLAATRGAGLLDRIAGLSGPRDLTPRAVDLRALLAEVEALAGPSLTRSVTLSSRVNGLDDPVLLDPDALRDALLNLVLNARDAMPEGGAITLSARPIRDTWVEIEVADTGPGFSEAALARGVEPFFTEKGEDGTGLGLSMVYDVVKLAGGRMALSNGKRGGARIALRLPLRQPPPGLPPTLVLLVEDAVHIREAARDRLVASGHSVLEASGVEEARGLLDIDGLGLVLSDIMLRTAESGLDLAREAAARGLPVALMTSLPPDAPLWREAAADWPVIRKPFSVEKLSAVLP
ncbi:hybrid sensor histidine kinase/response regulator [Jannaschia aquimarina]|uniref:histidine kinase n=1 Tax=Jannaschia aquimarina TaxID=935700 RepID=A0A0D1EHP9_9RHOB|nr:PAS-domain containing protein [Jannaschia aquimarina]KIT15325.1 Blue-light-activated protein [Jannaschia aquimarina]SNS51296.1 Signal transduction histidine kinase [Jannaschia aquimarina]